MQDRCYSDSPNRMYASQVAPDLAHSLLVSVIESVNASLIQLETDWRHSFPTAISCFLDCT